MLIVFVSGCSASFTYNNIGWLSGFWIDDYVDLNKQQSQTVKLLIKDTRDWHRTSQLPLYKSDLIYLQNILSDSPSEQALIEHFNNSREHWQTLVNKIAQPLIDVAKSLDENQKMQFIAKIRDDINEELEEYEKQTDAERSEERLEKQTDTYKEWLGKLSQQQLTLIAKANDSYEPRFVQWQKYKNTRLDALVAVFDNPAINEAEFSQNMLHIITEREAFMSQELIAATEKNQALYAKLLVELRHTLSPKQIKHAKDKFKDMIEEIDDLIVD
ncbi:DUF6279 family lipoprotein [Pseudoalteromonas atlantica]|uniref:DUF6279 family lipoprotein n=1 Tax=Pseudoalteromonas atlantica TaxID=288 RepID=UPI003736421A